MYSDNSLWLQVKDKLKSITDKSVYEQTYSPINDVLKIQDSYIYLIVNNAYDKYRIEKFYINTMNSVLNEFDDTKRFKLITKEDADKEKEKIVSNKTENTIIKSRQLRDDYTFANFVTGEANREAFTFATKVAESPNVTINPFYIFGDVGLGKTHLMMSIGHYILENNSSCKVIYTTALQFLEEFVNAKSKNQKDPSLANSFDSYYRSADLLLVDDIQFLESKQGLQDEFFKLFEYLFSNNKQIVVTSDKKASELNVMARLKSRFSWGIQTDIRKPNFELRLNILKKKLSSLVTDTSLVEIDALNYIAENFTENLRDLEGALRRFTTYCIAFNIPFNLSNAKLSLSTLISDSTKDTDEVSDYDIEIVKDAVSTYFNISSKDLSSTSRKKEHVYARDLCVYILKQKYDVTLVKIGYYLGKRDHSTIAHSLDKIDALVKINNDVKIDIDSIYKILSKSVD